MPGPSSSTVTTPPCRATRTVPPVGLHFTALSSRLVSARSIAPDSPSRNHGSTLASIVDRRWRGDGPGRPRCRATSCSSTVPTICSIGSSRASSTRSPTRVVSSSIWARTSASSSVRASSGRSVPAWVSRSMLVRSEVSGVRSSCPASATSCRCRSREAASDVSIWLNAVAEPGDLVVALDRQRREVLGARDPLHVRGDPADRPEPVAGHGPADERRDGHAGETDQEAHEAEAPERLLLVLQ